MKVSQLVCLGVMIFKGGKNLFDVSSGGGLVFILPLVRVGLDFFQHRSGRSLDILGLLLRRGACNFSASIMNCFPYDDQKRFFCIL